MRHVTTISPTLRGSAGRSATPLEPECLEELAEQIHGRYGDREIRAEKLPSLGLGHLPRCHEFHDSTGVPDNSIAAGISNQTCALANCPNLPMKTGPTVSTLQRCERAAARNHLHAAADHTQTPQLPIDIDRDTNGATSGRVFRPPGRGRQWEPIGRSRLRNARPVGVFDPARICLKAKRCSARCFPGSRRHSDCFPLCFPSDAYLSSGCRVR